MTDEFVRAAIHLHAVLRCMEDLCELDPVSRNLIADQRLTIRFSVPGIKRLYLVFSGGGCKAISSDVGPCDMNLHFFHAEHLNQMMAGVKNPIPTKGFRHIRFLKERFTVLADRLEFFLKPSPETLADPELCDISTKLSAYVAFFALSEIANLDEIGRVIASHMEEGVINIDVKNSIGIHFLLHGGTLQTVKGLHPESRACMSFSDIKTAGGILRGEIDSFASIGTGDLAISGRVPLVDNLNKLLSLVALYLSEEA